MIEEPLDFLFSIENIILESDNWSIPCLPGFSITLFSDDDIERTEKQEFNFRVKTKDILDNEIKINDSFSYSSGNYTYTFNISSVPIDDLTGLSTFRANYVSRETL